MKSAYLWSFGAGIGGVYRCLITLLVLPTCVVFIEAVAAHEAEPPLHQVIDEHVARGWATRGITPAELASDEEFARRVWLDLAGTIPTSTALRAFLDDPASDKRARLIDRLLASPEYARHMQHLFDVIFVERQIGNHVTEDEWREYLRKSFAENKLWDLLVREILSADATNEQTRAATRFYVVRTIDSYRVLNPHHLTRDLGRLFLGVNLQCAQCHDHPTIDAYTQSDYQGLKAFVERLYMLGGKQQEKAVMWIAEKPAGEVQYHSAFDPKHEVKTAEPHLPGSSPVLDPAIEKGKEYQVAPADGILPVPAYSRRAKLIEQLVSADNMAFRRASANRFWSLLFGRGLVHPIDMDHPGNPPSHPELLNELGRRFAAQKFDIRWLLREICQSRAYQLSSQSEVLPPPETFAVAPVRALRPSQLAMAALTAAGYVELQYATQGANASEQTVYAQLAGMVKQFDVQFGSPMGQQESAFEGSPFQVLFMQNGEVFNSFSRASPGTIVERLNKLTDSTALADELYLSIYSRRPTDEERQAVAAYVNVPAAEREATIGEYVWAMLTSAEFRFNH